MKIINRLGLIILFSIVGAIAMHFYNLLERKGTFVQWEALGKPPSTVIKLLGLGYVQTESGDIYQHSVKIDCGDKCWFKSDNPQLDSEYWLPLETCVDLPSISDFVDSKAICMLWGEDILLNIDAIDQNGNVYSWRHLSSSNIIYSLAPYVGAIIGFLFGCVVIIGLLFSDLVKEQQKEI